MASSSSANKFRPYFSPAELTEIIRCVKSSSTNINLLHYLENFAMKIDRGIISKQLTLAPTVSDRLGFNSPETSPAPYNPAELLAIWKANPEFLTPPQLEIVNCYRWEQGMMTNEQEQLYLQSIGML